ncbi:hypothetical protein [Streptomyces sp. NPDC052042]|uniref:hypothetical protein n=1 Tax=Streptomyces sp. NPDC052042 TaxID=3365683 RepID=UPI0037D6B0CA
MGTARHSGQCLALSETVGTHRYWASFTGEELEKRRMELKAATQPGAVAAADVTLGA